MLMSGLAFAQADTNTLTITATRNVTVVPDQVLYLVTVTTDFGAALDAVAGRLAAAGIASTDFVGVSDTVGASMAEWTFELASPFSQMKDTIAALTKARQDMAGAHWTLEFSAVGQSVSADAQAQACPLTALISDARRTAEQIGSAAGIRVGAIVGLSNAANGAATPTAASRAAVFTTLDPITGLGFSSFLIANPQPIRNNCSLTVQFRLLP
jgi:hypothetical protein